MGNVHFAPAAVSSAMKRSISGLNFSKIIYQTNSFRQLLSPKHAKVHIPGGFSYEAYNGQGYIQPWSILSLFENARAASFAKTKDGQESFLNVSDLYENYLMFIASSSTTVSPSLYDIAFPKASLDVHVKLTYAGRTSYKLQSLLFPGGTDKEPLIENNTQTVCVSTKTRRPSPLPDWWQEKYTATEAEPLKLQRLAIPEDRQFWKHSFEVKSSDLDPYMHVNWSSYVKYCYDAFVSSKYNLNPHSDGKNLFRSVKKFSVCYIKEASMGDNLDTKFWQDTANPDIYHFQVIKKSDVICECTFEFYLDYLF